jgi:hypothetical protein
MKMNFKTLMMATTLLMSSATIFAATSDPVAEAARAQTVRQVHAHGLDLRIAIPTEDQRDKFRTLIGIHWQVDERSKDNMISSLRDFAEAFHPDSVQHWTLTGIAELLEIDFHKQGENLGTMEESIECAAGLFRCAEPAFEMGGVVISPARFPTDDAYVQSIIDLFAPEHKTHMFARSMQEARG